MGPRFGIATYTHLEVQLGLERLTPAGDFQHALFLGGGLHTSEVSSEGLYISRSFDSHWRFLGLNGA